MFNLIVDIDISIADNTARAAKLVSRCNACGSTSTSHVVCSYCHSDLLIYTDESFQDFLDPKYMMDDIPVAEAQRVIKAALKEPKMYTVHYITGRKDFEHREVTTAWLKKHFDFSSVSTLSMRSRNEASMRPSDYKEVKFNKLKTTAGLKGSFIFFEDDTFVQGMYAKHGLVVDAPNGWSAFMPKGSNRLMERQLSR